MAIPKSIGEESARGADSRPPGYRVLRGQRLPDAPGFVHSPATRQYRNFLPAVAAWVGWAHYFFVLRASDVLPAAHGAKGGGVGFQRWRPGDVSGVDCAIDDDPEPIVLAHAVASGPGGADRKLLRGQGSAMGRDAVANGDSRERDLSERGVAVVASVKFRAWLRRQGACRSVYAARIEQSGPVSVDPRRSEPDPVYLGSLFERGFGHRHDRVAAGDRAGALGRNRRESAAVHDADGVEQPVGCRARIAAEGAAANNEQRECKPWGNPVAGR